MNKTNICLPVLLTLALTACSSMSKRECLNADWYLVGLGDGTQGRPLAKLDDHRRACARVDVTPDHRQYRAGHEDGLLEYCTVHRGYTEGLKGASYHGVCPPELESDFRRAYDDGRELFSVSSSLSAISATLVGHQARIVEIEEDIAQREQDIVSQGSTAQSRREHLDKIRILRDELSDIHDAMSAAEYDQARLEEDLEALLHRHQRLGYR